MCQKVISRKGFYFKKFTISGEFIVKKHVQGMDVQKNVIFVRMLTNDLNKYRYKCFVQSTCTFLELHSVSQN